MNRRRILAAIGAGWVGAWLPGSAQSQTECGAPTPANAEGPFYRPGAPETATLNDAGRLLVSGRVLDASCGPARNGVIEVWQANEEGEYDLQGYQHRGVVRCDAEGRYAFRTVRPGHYLNGRSYRPAHIHVKIHMDGRSPLTTQLYFAGDPYNDNDPWFRSSLMLRETPHGCGGPDPSRLRPKRFDFVV